MVRVVAHRLEQVGVFEVAALEGPHLTQRRLQRPEGVLDAAARLDVGSLLDQPAHELLAEGGEQRLQQRRAAAVVGRHGGPHGQHLLLRRRGERGHLGHEGGHVPLDLQQQHAREEGRELRYPQPLAHGGRRAAVARVRLEVGLLRVEAVAHREPALLRLGGRAVADGKVAERELQVGGHGIGQVVGHVGAGVHQVDLCEHAHGALARGVDLLDELHRGICLEIGSRRADEQDDRALLLDEGGDHASDLRLDVVWLALVGERRHRQAGQVDERQVGHIRRVDAQEDGLVRYALLAARARLGLILDGAPDVLELRGRRLGALQRDAHAQLPRPVAEVAELGAHRRGVGCVEELQRERRARDHLLAQREDVRRHDTVEQRRLAARLCPDHDEPRHLGRLERARRGGEDAVERVGDSQNLAAAERAQARRLCALAWLHLRAASRHIAGDRAAHVRAGRTGCPERAATDRLHHGEAAPVLREAVHMGRWGWVRLACWLGFRPAAAMIICRGWKPADESSRRDARAKPRRRPRWSSGGGAELQ